MKDEDRIGDSDSIARACESSVNASNMKYPSSKEGLFRGGRGVRVSSHNYGYDTYDTFALFPRNSSIFLGRRLFFNDIERKKSLVSGYPCPKSLPTMKILKIIRHVAHLGTGSQHERNNFQK